MRYFKPDLRLASELPEQSQPEDKLGGLPWGLPAALWPVCECCGNPQTLLAQFNHHPDRLDLGRKGRSLYVFYCGNSESGCPTYDPESGANACLVLDPEDQEARLSSPPDGMTDCEREARVVGWVAHDDGVEEIYEVDFLSYEGYEALPDSVKYLPDQDTKLGSAPSWVQNPEAPPDYDWRFVCQLNDFYTFRTKPADGAEDIWEQKDDRGTYYTCSGPNFGDAGTAYIFLRDTAEQTPEGWFCWQCH